jgi:hypothetical protein
MKKIDTKLHAVATKELQEQINIELLSQSSGSILDTIRIQNEIQAKNDNGGKDNKKCCRNCPNPR